MSVSYDPLEYVDAWFEQMMLIRSKTINYTTLARGLTVKPPVHMVCQLLGVNNLAEVFSDDILYRAVVRVAQMQAAELVASEAPPPVLDATSLQPVQHASLLDTTTVSITPPPAGNRASTAPAAAAHRPETLTALLDLVKKSETLGLDRYARFLTAADDAHTEMLRSGVVAIAPKFMVTDAKPAKQVHTTCAIRDIFGHYVLVRTYKETVEPQGVREMSIKALMAFCRDFDVCPRLVTKDEVRLILSVMDVRNARKGLKKLKALDLEDLKDFLVRLALFAYNKPATKKAILKLNNERTVSQLDLVEFLCQYLHLGDLKWVRDRLKSTLYKVDLCTFGTEESYKAKIKEGPHTVAPGTPEKEKVGGHYAAVSVGTMPFLIERERQNTALEGIKTKPRPKPFPDNIEALFAKNASRLADQEAAAAAAGAEETSRAPPDTASLAGSRAGPGRAGSNPTSVGAAGASKGRSVTVGWGATVTLGGPAPAPANVTEEQRALINGELDPPLKRSLERFTQQKDMKPAETLWFASRGCFLDMGRLDKGKEVEVSLLVTNCSRDHVYIDATCKGLDSPDTRVVTKPCAVAPGLSRPISVLFTVQPGDRTALGTIQVFVASIRTGLGLVFDVPVHYRVGPPRPETDGYLCTLSNMDMLKGRFLGGRSVDATQTRLVRPFDTHRTNAGVKERETFFDITRFPRISDNTVVTGGTYSTVFSSKWDGV